MELKQKIKTIILDERKENLKNSLNELKNIRDKSFRSERSFQILINLLNCSISFLSKRSNNLLLFFIM
jgi:hypothetical protein